MNPACPCAICGQDFDEDDEVAYAEDGDPVHGYCYEDGGLIDNPDFDNAEPWGVK